MLFQFDYVIKNLDDLSHILSGRLLVRMGFICGHSLKDEACVNSDVNALLVLVYFLKSKGN